MKYFNRKAEVNIHDSEFHSDNLDIEFTVPFDDNTEADESEVTIYNLLDPSINRIKKDQEVFINAGYEGDVGTVLSAYVVKVSTEKGIDKKTVVKVMDKPPFDAEKAAEVSFKKNIKASQILNDLLSRLKLEVSMDLPKDKTYAKGYDVDGEIGAEISNIAKDCGANFFINKGTAYIQPIQSDKTPAFLLSPSTGLIGTPSPFEEESDGETISGFKVECLLQHRITTGSVIEIESSTANGTYYVRKGTHRWSKDSSVTEMEVIT